MPDPSQPQAEQIANQVLTDYEAWLRSPSDTNMAIAYRGLRPTMISAITTALHAARREGMECGRADRVRRIRCKTPTDIFLVETPEMARALCQSGASTCGHPHRIIMQQGKIAIRAAAEGGTG